MLSRLILSSFLLALLGLGGCWERSPQITPIVELNDTQQPDVLVYVEGTVRDRAPLLNQTAYELEDDTGKIWVVTSDSSPESGQRVAIQAKIKSKSIVLNQIQSEEVYLQEVRQLRPQQ